ncbi:hypothetical protein CRENBAI_013455 [Crenichthys baileyi]|uniref:B box-type domain-containing protein n=1 Tax=Crenichthys baileyi TaxID=28760 RepID=A0AAV9SJ43_9TELE
MCQEDESNRSSSKATWDQEDRKGVHSCPQCRKTFIPRPVLVKNILLAALVEDLKKTGLPTAPPGHCYAGPEDGACDVCTGRKNESWEGMQFCNREGSPQCEQCLQEGPWARALDGERESLTGGFNAAFLMSSTPALPARPGGTKIEVFKDFSVTSCKNNLIRQFILEMKENICSRHDEVMKIFCRTDQQCICYLCTMDEHKGHETVSAAAEKINKQKELQVSREQIQQRIQDQEKDLKLLHQEVEAVNVSADKAVKDSEKIFTELIHLIQKRSSDVKQQIRSQQETEVSRVKDLQEKLEQEITELKRKDAELEQLSNTEDHNQFLHNYPSLSALSESTHSSSINIRPQRYFEDVTAAVSELRDKLQDILRDAWTNISLAVTEVEVLLLRPEPKTRAEFFEYFQEITLDRNTANRTLLLSEENRKPMKSRPLSVLSPPGPVPVPGGGVSTNRNFNKDKAAPVITCTPSKVCRKCSKVLSSTQPAVKAMDKVFHSSCFCCMSCCRPLQAMPFYYSEGSPQCERCYMSLDL